MLRSVLFATLSAVALTTASITGATENAAPKSAQVTSDIPDKFTIPNEDADYDTRVEMIPMRDGTKRSEEHTSELQSLMRISSAVFSLKKNTNIQQQIKAHTSNKKTLNKHVL